MEIIERLLLGTTAGLLVRGRDGDVVKAFSGQGQLVKVGRKPADFE